MRQRIAYIRCVPRPPAAPGYPRGWATSEANLGRGRTRNTRAQRQNCWVKTLPRSEKLAIGNIITGTAFNRRRQ